jgi:adenosylcobinamide-GDP ribazoletransferase
MKGLALVLSWLTVLPVRSAAPDARTAAAALRWSPVVGALIGVATGAVVVGLVAAGVPVAVAGFLGVGFAALVTRGMHLDGLADTADGLGCYGPPERALAVMRDGGAGPFAVVTLLVVVGAQAATLAALAGPVAALAGPATAVAAQATGLSGAPTTALTPAAGHIAAATGAPTTAAGAGAPGSLLDAAAAVAGVPNAGVTALGVVATVALAGASGRAAFLWVARRGVPAARPGGLGATVAESQPWWAAVVWWAALAVGGWVLAGLHGVLAVGLGAVAVVALSRHTARRFGGMTGDVLGAASELATTAALIVLAAR